MPTTLCLLKHSHPSRSEADYCLWLQARVYNKEIIDFKYIGTVDLHVAGKLWKQWAIDFKVTEKDGSISYHESKGWNRSDDVFRMKLAAFRLEYPEIPIYVNKRRITAKGWRRDKPKGGTPKWILKIKQEQRARITALVMKSKVLRQGLSN